MDQDDFRALLAASRAEKPHPSRDTNQKKRSKAGSSDTLSSSNDITTAHEPRQTGSTKRDNNKPTETKNNKNNKEQKSEEKSNNGGGGGYVDRAARRRAGLEDEKSEVEKFLWDRLDNATTAQERKTIEEQLVKIVRFLLLHTIIDISIKCCIKLSVWV